MLNTCSLLIPMRRFASRNTAGARVTSSLHHGPSRPVRAQACVRWLHLSPRVQLAPPRQSIRDTEEYTPESSRPDNFDAEDPAAISKILAANTTMSGYNLRQIHDSLIEMGLTPLYPPMTPQRVLYINIDPTNQFTTPRENAPSFANNQTQITQTYLWLDDGTIVAWGASDEDFKSLLAFTSPGAPPDLKFYERLSFRYSQFAGYDSNKDLIHLSEEADNLGEKLAFSYGIARSVKLEAVEALVESAVNEIGHKIPEFFMQGARLKWFDSEFNTREINKKVGMIMKLRTDINVKADMSEIPDYLWEEEPKHERLYMQIEKALDIRPRLASMNKKLNMADQDLSIINNYISTHHMSRGDLIIILLLVLSATGLIMEKLGAWHDFRWERFFEEQGWTSNKKAEEKPAQE